jgi:hypothetical protein
MHGTTLTNYTDWYLIGGLRLHTILMYHSMGCRLVAVAWYPPPPHVDLASRRVGAVRREYALIEHLAQLSSKSPTTTWPLACGAVHLSYLHAKFRGCVAIIVTWCTSAPSTWGYGPPQWDTKHAVCRDCVAVLVMMFTTCPPVDEEYGHSWPSDMHSVKCQPIIGLTVHIIALWGPLPPQRDLTHAWCGVSPSSSLFISSPFSMRTLSETSKYSQAGVSNIIVLAVHICPFSVSFAWPPQLRTVTTCPVHRDCVPSSSLLLLTPLWNP